MAVVEPEPSGTATAVGLDAKLAAALSEAAMKHSAVIRLLRTDDETHAAMLGIPKAASRRRAPSRGFAPPRCPDPHSVSGTFVTPSAVRALSGMAEEVASRFREHAVVERGPLVPATLPGFRCAFDDATQGDIVHGWIEHWGLRSDPDERTADTYLKLHWPALASIKGLAAGLCTLVPALRAMPRLRETIDSPSTQLIFEHPILARIGADVISGRIDLLAVDRTRRTARIVDFKAGWGHPADKVIRSSLPGIDEYSKQLGAYAAGVESAGLRVLSVGLVYAGIPAVAWLES